jgi:hypothetical protein
MPKLKTPLLFRSYFSILTLFIVLILYLTACLSPWQEQEGTITINLGGSTNARFLPFPPSDDLLNDIRYEIELTSNGRDTISISAKGGDTIRQTVLLGYWDIKVDAWLDVQTPASSIGEEVHYATGSESIQVREGQNTVSIRMNRICQTCGEFPCSCEPDPCAGGCDWELITIIFASHHNNDTDVCGNGTKTYTCTLCGEIVISTIPCLGTKELDFALLDDDNEAYEVTGIDIDVTHVCIPDYHEGKPVVSIGKDAFYGNDDNGAPLISVRIGVNVVYIGDNAFDMCGNLETVTFAEGSRLETIGDYAFYETGITSITIPAGVTSIGDFAFGFCESLETVTFAEGSRLETIGVGAFEGCTSLTNITIPVGVTSIGNGAFESCGNLKTVTFAEGSLLETIGNNAFESTGITSITIPASVTSIGDSAFADCTSLETVTVLATDPPTLGQGAFDFLQGFTIRVPTNSVAAYVAAPVWNGYGNSIAEIP